MSSSAPFNPADLFNDVAFAPPTAQRTNDSHIKLLYDAECPDSRRVLQIVRDHGLEPDIIHLTHSPLSQDEVRGLLRNVQGDPHRIVRTNHPLFKNHPFNLNDIDRLCMKLSKSPELVQRPIVYNAYSNIAIIARPPELVSHLIKSPLFSSRNEDASDMSYEEVFPLPLRLQREKDQSFKKQYYQQLREKQVEKTQRAQNPILGLLPENIREEYTERDARRNSYRDLRHETTEMKRGTYESFLQGREERRVAREQLAEASKNATKRRAPARYNHNPNEIIPEELKFNHEDYLK